jgi:Sad1 / UNC-like C-terminal
VFLATKTLWSAEFYGFDITHNIGQFIPYSIAHPFDNFSPPEIKDIHRRLNDLEYQVAKIKIHTEIDPKTFAKLENLLPDALLVKKDKYGNLVIPDDFWHALQDKIRSDQTLITYNSDDKGTSQGSGLSVKDMERIAGREYEKFMKSNQAKMTAVLGDELAKKFPRLLEDNHIASKVEILQMVRQNWVDNQKEIKLEMNLLTKKLENASRQIHKLQQDPAGLTTKEVRAIAEELVRKLLPNAQLEALARSNLQQTVNYGLTRVNHFSKGTGAVIDPYNTSPNYVFPSQDVYFPYRWARAFMLNSIPAPKAPETALTRWDEHGDCWCSPSNAANGFGTSLGVIMASVVYPDQVIVEHISPSAALEPGAAPREMEVFALMDPTSDTYNSVKAMSENIFGAGADTPMPYGWIRIASFTYDLESNQNVQSFPVQMDMKALGASTNKIIVRSKSNWGGEKVGYTCIYRIRLHGEIAA